MGNTVRKALIIVIGVLIVIFAGAFYYNHEIIMKRPVYAAGLIKDAVAKKDRDAFLKYVDLEKIVTGANRDFALAVFAAKREGKGSVKSIEQLGLIRFVLKGAVEREKNELLISLMDPLKEPEKPRLLESRVHEFLINASVTEVKEEKNDGENATLNLKVKEEGGRERDVKVRMHKNAEGIWRAEEIPGFVEIFYPDLAEAAGDYRRPALGETDALKDLRNLKIRLDKGEITKDEFIKDAGKIIG